MANIIWTHCAARSRIISCAPIKALKLIAGDGVQRSSQFKRILKSLVVIFFLPGVCILCGTTFFFFSYNLAQY